MFKLLMLSHNGTMKEPELNCPKNDPKTSSLKRPLEYVSAHRPATIVAMVAVLLAIGFIVFAKLNHARPKTTPRSTSRSPNNTPTQPAVSTNPLFGVPCKNDPKPVFSHDLTDPSLIDHIQIYGLGESTPRFRSFLWIKAKGTKIPVYAPVDSDMVEAVYKTARGTTDFDVHMMVSCQVWYLVNHITDPVDKIRKALPATPATTTVDPPRIAPTIHFAAGELLGYTSGTPVPSNWDFGVFDLTHANQFVNQARFDHDRYGKVQTAICPFDVFSEIKKAAYYGLFGETKPVAGAKCGAISPDKAGTISGSWFDTADISQPQLHFKLMIGTYVDSVIRISGEDFQPPIEIAPTNSTYLESQSVTTRHCYASGGQAVDFKVVSGQEIQVYRGTGSCHSTFPASGYKTYYR
jgi:hypothetical protein